MRARAHGPTRTSCSTRLADTRTRPTPPRDTSRAATRGLPSRCRAGAGVLFALAAHALVLSEHAALGLLAAPAPECAALDALRDLTRREMDALGARARALRDACGPDLSVETAIEALARLTAGVLAPLSARLDLRAIGEAAAERAAVEHYGRRLLERGANVPPSALERLLSAYPSPDFPIDREEAKDLLGDVRAPTACERLLAETLGVDADRAPAFLSTERPSDDGAP